MTRILIIDDDSEITTMLETVLSSGATHVKSAHNGREGLRLLGEHPYDVVITDIIMPESDGFEVIRAVNTMRSRPRLVVITGGTERLSREYLSSIADAMRVDAVLLKPFTIDDLLLAIFACEGCGDCAGEGEQFLA